MADKQPANSEDSTEHAPAPEASETPTSEAPKEPKGPADHLRPFCFQKGQSGNPAGRPKGQSITDALRRIVETPDIEGRTGADRLAEVAVEYAKKGRFLFFKEVIDRLEGKVADESEMSGTLIIKIDKDDANL